MKIIISEKQSDVLTKGWENVKNKKLVKKYHFDSYKELISFINQVAKVAEKQSHHPEIKFGYDFVEITISDHKKGGISEKCHKFIKAVNQIDK